MTAETWLVSYPTPSDETTAWDSEQQARAEVARLGGKAVWWRWWFLENLSATKGEGK